MPHSFFEEPLQGKSNKTPFMAFIGRAQGLVHFSNAIIKIQLPFTFQLGYRVSSPCSKTAVFSKKAFKLLLTVAFSAPSCLHFRELMVCWALSAHPKKNQKKKSPKSPQIPQSGMLLHECDPCKRDDSVHISWVVIHLRSRAPEEGENSSPCSDLAP